MSTIVCNKDCTKCKHLSGKTDDKRYPFGYECMKYGNSTFREKFRDAKVFHTNKNMITWKCLRKLDQEELAIILNDIHSGISYTVEDWEDIYPTDEDILKYANVARINRIKL